MAEFDRFLESGEPFDMERPTPPTSELFGDLSQREIHDVMNLLDAAQFFQTKNENRAIQKAFEAGCDSVALSGALITLSSGGADMGAGLAVSVTATGTKIVSKIPGSVHALSKMISGTKGAERRQHAMNIFNLVQNTVMRLHDQERPLSKLDQKLIAFMKAIDQLKDVPEVVEPEPHYDDVEITVPVDSQMEDVSFDAEVSMSVDERLG